MSGASSRSVGVNSSRIWEGQMSTCGSDYTRGRIQVGLGSSMKTSQKKFHLSVFKSDFRNKMGTFSETEGIGIKL